MHWSLALVFAAPAFAQPSTDILTLASARELALELQPSVHLAVANRDIAAARSDQARVVETPTVGVYASPTIGSAPAATCFNSSCPTLGSVTVGGQLAWRVYDFGVTAANVHAADLASDAGAQAIASAKLDVVLGVDIAYLATVAQHRLTSVAETTVKSEEGHVDQARRFVDGGAQDPIALVQAQARLANARAALSQARSAEAASLSNLRAAIGIVDPRRTINVIAAWPQRTNDIPDLTKLVDIARTTRPDIVQLDLLVASAQASLDAARAERRPVLSAEATAGWTPNTTTSSPQPIWSAGLTLSLPLFDGGKASSDTALARGQLAAASANRDALLVTLTSQLEAARTQILANRDNVQASEEAVVAAREQLKLSEARYSNGLGSQIELTDAQTAVTTAEGSLVSAEWQLATAWAQLDRAIGHAL